jgi:hypothetical protein
MLDGSGSDACGAGREELLQGLMCRNRKCVALVDRLTILPRCALASCVCACRPKPGFRNVGTCGHAAWLVCRESLRGALSSVIRF